MNQIDTNKMHVFETTIEVLNDKGLKFTMDDIAKKLGMSKKTLYLLFHDKEELFRQTIDFGFIAVKQSEKEILENEKLSLIEKIKKIIIVLPERYQHIDFRKFSELKDKYPRLYSQVEERIENDWEPTLDLLKQGIKQGLIKNINLFILKSMIEASMEHFLDSKMLMQQNITYENALNEMIEIIMQGITVK